MEHCWIRTVIVALISATAGICAAQEPGKIGPWGPQPIMHPATEQKSPSELPFRSWQLQNDNENALKLIAAAPDYGVNNIQLSHRQVMYAYKLLENKNKIKAFNGYIKLAHKNGATVHIWTHEFGGIPKSITEGHKWFDQPAVWELLDKRYTKLFEVMPDLDGVVLTFHETEIKVFDVESDLSIADRVAKLINHLHTTFKRFNKTLVVRTFAYEPQEVEDIAKAFAKIDPEVILMSKEIPHDWEVFFPHNLAIGRYPDRKHLIEFDPGAEYYGLGRVAYLFPEYIHFRLEYARNRNAYGYVARVERQDHPSAIRGVSEGSGLNELNLYALSRFAADSTVGPEEVWRDYMEKRVGKGDHVEPLIEAMKLTDDALNRCYFMLGAWYNNHSKLPADSYAERSIDNIEKWNPLYKPVIKRLMNPDARTVGEVFRESEESIIIARRALDHLEQAQKAGLNETHYNEFKSQLSHLLSTAKAWAEHRKSYIQKKAKGVEPTYDGPFPIGGPPRLDDSHNPHTFLPADRVQ